MDDLSVFTPGSNRGHIIVGYHFKNLENMAGSIIYTVLGSHAFQKLQLRSGKMTDNRKTSHYVLHFAV